MIETLSFPGLGLELTLNRAAFTIGGFTIYWYGILIGLAFLAGITYILYQVRSFGLDADRVIDVILGGAVGAIIGARAYYVLFSWDMFKDNLWDIFNTRQGGIAIYGAVIGGFIAGFIVCRFRQVRFVPMADLAVGGLLLGQAIGRWGNFVNIEAFGGNTTMPWGMTSPTIVNYLTQHKNSLAAINMTVDPQMPVHPTFFYESIWCLIGFILLVFLTKKRRFDGELLLFYCIWYGVGRAVIEGLRTDSLLLGTLRVSQVLAVLCVIVAALIWLSVRSKIRRNADEDYLKLYVNTDEGQMVLAGTFYKKKVRHSKREEEERAQEREVPLEEAEADKPQEETVESTDSETTPDSATPENVTDDTVSSDEHKGEV